MKWFSMGTKRERIILVICMLFLAVMAYPADAAESWEIEDPPGSNARVTSVQSMNSLMRFGFICGVTTDYIAWGIQIDDRFTADKEYTMKARVDDSEVFNMKGKAITESMILVPVDDPILMLIADGTRLSIQSITKGGEKYMHEFSLKDSRKNIETTLDACIDEDPRNLGDNSTGWIEPDEEGFIESGTKYIPGENAF